MPLRYFNFSIIPNTKFFLQKTISINTKYFHTFINFKNIISKDILQLFNSFVRKSCD